MRNNKLKSGCVLHLFGQSNADGRAPVPSNRVNKCGMVLTDGMLVTETNSVGQMDGKYGVEIVLSELWKDNDGLMLIKTAQGGANIDYVIKNLLSAHFGKITNAVITGKQNLLLWVHGETDASNLTSESEYQQKELEIFDAFIDAMPDTEIFSVVLNDSLPSEYQAGYSAINAAKAKNAQLSNVHLIGNDYEFGSDGLHYNAAGLEGMALDLLDEISRLREP